MDEVAAPALQVPSTSMLSADYGGINLRAIPGRRCGKAAAAAQSGHRVGRRAPRAPRVGLAPNAVVALAHQPVSDAEGERDGGEPEELLRPGRRQVEHDELAREREERDQQHDLRLDHALLAGDDVLQRVDWNVACSSGSSAPSTSAPSTLATSR